jgi:hypothetical protein
MYLVKLAARMGKMVHGGNEKSVIAYCGEKHKCKVRTLLPGTLITNIRNDMIYVRTSSVLGDYVLIWAPDNIIHPALDYDFNYGYDSEDELIEPNSENDVYEYCHMLKRYGALEAKRIKVETSLMAKFDLTLEQVRAINKYRLGKLIVNVRE